MTLAMKNPDNLKFHETLHYPDIYRTNDNRHNALDAALISRPTDVDLICALLKLKLPLKHSILTQYESFNDKEQEIFDILHVLYITQYQETEDIHLPAAQSQYWQLINQTIPLPTKIKIFEILVFRLPDHAIEDINKEIKNLPKHSNFSLSPYNYSEAIFDAVAKKSQQLFTDRYGRTESLTSFDTPRSGSNSAAILSPMEDKSSFMMINKK